MEKEKRLIVIDGNAIIHRAYHALPPLTTKKGELVNAVYGFLLFFLKALRELQPDYIAVTFDFPAPTFRHEKFKDYKATRPKAPEELYQQIPKVKEILGAFNIPIFEKEGFEADDLIATISRLAPKKQIIPARPNFSKRNLGGPEIETIILSGDLDTLQLVDPHTKVYTLKKGIKDTVLYDKNLVKKKYQGLTPSQLPDFKALKGDPSDNIPGVPGIGEKTAIELIKKFGSIENLYKEIEEKGRKARELKSKLKEVLVRFREQTFFSKILAQTKKDVPIDFNLEKCRFKKYDKDKVAEIFKKYEFNSLVARLPALEESQPKREEKSSKRKNPNLQKELKLW